jgi:hypothetical protein
MTFSLTTFVVSFDRLEIERRQIEQTFDADLFETTQLLKSKTARLGTTLDCDLRLTKRHFQDLSVSSHNDCTASFHTAIEYDIYKNNYKLL